MAGRLGGGRCLQEETKNAIQANGQCQLSSIIQEERKTADEKVCQTELVGGVGGIQAICTFHSGHLVARHWLPAP